jgi:hypothetical protein
MLSVLLERTRTADDHRDGLSVEHGLPAAMDNPAAMKLSRQPIHFSIPDSCSSDRSRI